MKNRPPADKVFVPIHHAAQILGIPAAWLRREAEAGRIPAIRAGRRWLIHFDRAQSKLTNFADGQDGGPTIG